MELMNIKIELACVGLCGHRRLKILKVDNPFLYLAFQKITDAFLFDTAGINIIEAGLSLTCREDQDKKNEGISTKTKKNLAHSENDFCKCRRNCLIFMVLIFWFTPTLKGAKKSKITL